MVNTSVLLSYYRVTEQQVSMAHRVEDDQLNRVWYAVESASVPGQEYKVIFDPVKRRLRCLPFNGEPCPASMSGTTCWHMRAALAASEEYRREKIEMQERLMIELAAEMAEEARAHSPYTVVDDESSSSLDGVIFEDVNGRPCPMK